MQKRFIYRDDKQWFISENLPKYKLVDGELILTDNQDETEIDIKTANVLIGETDMDVNKIFEINISITHIHEPPKKEESDAH